LEPEKNGEVYPALLTISGVRSESGELTHYVGSSADLSRIKSWQIELERRAHHDDLTGLPNRRLFTARLDQATARARANLLEPSFLSIWTGSSLSTTAWDTLPVMKC
jgi:hypothetical protein